METQAREMAKDMTQKMVNDILSQRCNVSSPPKSPRGDQERCLLQEKQAYMDAFIQCEVEKRAHEIACQKLNDILLLGAGNGSPPPSSPLRITRHMSPSQSSEGNRRQPSPPPRYQQRQMSPPRNSQQHSQFTTHGFGVDYDLLKQNLEFHK